MTELHELAEQPNWSTKQRCTCGYESVSKCEQWQHQAEQLRARLVALTDELAECRSTVGELVVALSEECNARSEAEARLAALTDECREQWLEAHFDHCGRWPHWEGVDCYWPMPETLRSVLDSIPETPQ